MMKYLFLSALIPFFLPDLTGTYSREKQFHENNNDYLVTWTLNLKKDSSYTLFTLNTGITTFCYIKSVGDGKWSVKKDTLKLTSSLGGLRRFVIKDKKLVALDEPYFPAMKDAKPPLDTLVSE